MVYPPNPSPTTAWRLLQIKKQMHHYEGNAHPHAHMLGWGKGKSQLGRRRHRRKDTFQCLLCYTSTYHLQDKVKGKSEGTQAQLLVGFHTAYLHKKGTQPVL